MREFITRPLIPTIANPGCFPEFHTPTPDEWQTEVVPVVEWILAGCHLAPFPHPLLTKSIPIKNSPSPPAKPTPRKKTTLVQE